MKKHNAFESSWWQQVKQDVVVLRHLFPWRTGLLLVIVIALMAIVYRLAHNTWSTTELSYIKAVYAILNMMAFQISFADMPQASELDIFFVVVPLLGLPLLLVFGANILNVLRIFFVRQERDQKWQHALAGTLTRPIVVCGLGRVGYRVANQLVDLGHPTVGIEAVPSPLVDALMEKGMPVIIGDIRYEDILRSAGIARARTVLICTHNDLANIEAAFHTREMNQDADIILRLFEDEISQQIQKSFDVKTILSRSAIAAQAFAYAALGLEVLETFSLDAQTYCLAKIPLTADTLWEHLTIQELSEAWDITVTCLSRQGHLITEPPADFNVDIQDILFVFAHIQQLPSLAKASLGQGPHTSTRGDTVMVCGLGHTGYRVVNALVALNAQIIAMDFEPSRLSERLKETGIAVLYGDFRQRAILEQSGIHQAKAVIACTEDDMVNFETALRAREARPCIRMIVRIFEDSLGAHLQRAFHLHAVYSTSALAAPTFVSAALNMHISAPSQVGEEQNLIARLVIEKLSGLYRETISTLTQQEGLTVLLHKTEQAIHIPPLPQAALVPGDEIVVFASEEQLQALILRNRGSRDVR